MDYWIVRIHFANDEHHEHDCREDQSPCNPARREPILLLALIQHKLKAADTDGKHSNAPCIDLCRRAPDVGRIEDE